MQLLPVVIFIVLLSFIGIYINVFKSPNLKDPELFKLPKMFRSNKTNKEELDLSQISANDLAAKIVEEKDGNNNIYDAMGNLIGVRKDYINEGMENGFIPSDTDSKNLSSVGSKRPYAWHGASSQKEWPDNKTVNAGLSYNVYYPLDKEALKPITSADIKDKHVKMTGPETKKSQGEQNVGFFLGKDKTYDELESNQSNKNINQAIAIIRNATSNEGKQLVYVDPVDRTKTNERYGKKNNNSISSYTNVKLKPDINTSLTDKDVTNIISKDIIIDPTGQLINQTREFING